MRRGHGRGCGDEASWRWNPGNDLVDSAVWGDDQPSATNTDRNATAFKEMGNWRLDNLSGLTVQAYVCECGD